ncbi:VOC family protein [Maribacter aestuarii]|uniref:VOC family protein n=1 Tax=Maribacter aestuarii TaxID=1130723 RepID=UPI00248AADB7|nr:VOC family protein [Maribacter aestuarii]
MERNMVGWFEVPVTNMERAKKFYETVFDISIAIHELGDFIMGWFPMSPDKPGATGSLVQHNMYVSSDTHGTLIYFSCKDVADELSRVVGAGGQVLQQKTEIGGGHGFMGLIRDTEGNRIAVHSNQ